MSDDTTNTTEQHQPPDFSKGAWVALLGIRQRKEGEPELLPHNMIAGPGYSPEVIQMVRGGVNVDRTIPAVHFGYWLVKNLGAIAQMWEVEYAQYMNLRLAEQANKPPVLKLVDPDGNRLQ